MAIVHKRCVHCGQMMSECHREQNLIQTAIRHHKKWSYDKPTKEIIMKLLQSGDVDLSNVGCMPASNIGE